MQRKLKPANPAQAEEKTITGGACTKKSNGNKVTNNKLKIEKSSESTATVVVPNAPSFTLQDP